MNLTFNKTVPALFNISKALAVSRISTPTIKSPVPSSIKGVETLSVPQRATVTNMGAELGVTTSLFPSDEKTRQFLDKVNDYLAFMSRLIEVQFIHELAWWRRH